MPAVCRLSESRLTGLAAGCASSDLRIAAGVHAVCIAGWQETGVSATFTGTTCLSLPDQNLFGQFSGQSAGFKIRAESD